jgi:hypothetical protein
MPLSSMISLSSHPSWGRIHSAFWPAKTKRSDHYWEWVRIQSLVECTAGVHIDHPLLGFTALSRHLLCNHLGVKLRWWLDPFSQWDGGYKWRWHSSW